jgi:hypothetical protein
MPASPARRSIFRNVALWPLALVMLVLVAAVVFTYMAYREAATELVLERDAQVTELSAARLQQALGNYGDVLTELARTREMSDGGIGTQLSAVDAAAARLTVFDGGVVLIDGRGRVRGGLPARPTLVGSDWSDRDFFQDVLAGDSLSIADAQQLAPGDPYVVVLAVPIRGEDNAFVGALAGAFRLGEPTLSVFYANIVRLRLGQTGTSYVVDGTGRILFDSESEAVGRFHDHDALLFYSSLSGSAADLTQDESGRDVIAAYAPVPGTDWTLIVEDDWSIVTRETSRYRDILMLSFLAAMLLPPIVVVVVSRQRRIPFLEVRRREADQTWLKAVRDQTRPSMFPVMPGWQLLAVQVAGKSPEHEFYDLSLLPDGRLSLALGSLSGAGVPAGVALASLRAGLRSAGHRLLQPGAALHECNALLSTEDHPVILVRCLCLMLDPASGKAEFSAAGVRPPRLRDGRVVQDTPVAGQPLGVGAAADLAEGELRIGPRGLVILLGPSMLEARDADGRAFVDQALEAAVQEWRSGPQDLIDRIVEAFKTFNEKSPLFAPDVTVILLEREGAER